MPKKNRLPIPYEIRSKYNRRHCQECGKRFPVKVCEYHHIIPYAIYPCHKDIICVCPDCHVKLQLELPKYHKDAHGHRCKVCKCEEYDVKWEIRGFWLCGWCVNKITQNQQEYILNLEPKQIKELQLMGILELK